MSVTLHLDYPPSANVYWRHRVMNASSKGGRPMATTFLSADAKKFKADVLSRARAAGIIAPITGRIKVEVWLYPHRPKDYATRIRKLGEHWDDTVQCIDLDNANKVLLDALKNVAFEDDKFVRQLLAQRMEPDEHGSRVTVRITKIQPTLKQIGLALVDAVKGAL